MPKPARPAPIRSRATDAARYDRFMRNAIIAPMYADLSARLLPVETPESAIRALQGWEFVPDVDEAFLAANFRTIADWHTGRVRRAWRYVVEIPYQRQVQRIGPRRVRTQFLPQPPGFNIRRKVQENVALIRTLSPRAQASLYRRLTEWVTTDEAIFAGESAGGILRLRLEAFLREVEGITAAQARLIARDQTTKAVGLLTELRQREIGVEQYDWASQQDSRVRPLHASYDGQRFRWDSPPEDGPPGTAVACRCAAIPVLVRTARVAVA